MDLDLSCQVSAWCSVEVFSSGKLGSSSCFWVEWRLPMCFPSTLQLERSISLCGVTLANSPALDHNTAEQNGGRRTNSARRERLQCSRTGQEGEDQTETGRERRRQDEPEQEKTDEWSRDALGHDKISIRAYTGMLYIGYISPYLICCWILKFIVFIWKYSISLDLNPNSQHCKEQTAVWLTGSSTLKVQYVGFRGIYQQKRNIIFIIVFL